MNRDDELLVARVKSELPYQTKAFEQLAIKYYPIVRQLLKGIVGTKGDADSVAQDVMLRVFHSIKGLKENAAFEGWLRRIVVNAANSFLSKESRERKKVENSYSENPNKANRSGGDDNESESFEKLINTLNQEERTILSFKFVEDLDFAQIADIVGLELSATKMRYYRALDKLRVL